MDLEPRFTEEEIAEAVSRVAGEISANHRNTNPLLVGILIGSFVFLSDLLRQLDVPVEIDFIRARSYGSGMKSSGAIEITEDIEHDVTDRSVIIVEDILDSGLTLRFVGDRIRAGGPASVETRSLLVREGRRAPRLHGSLDPRGLRRRPRHRLCRAAPRAARHQSRPRHLSCEP